MIHNGVMSPCGNVQGESWLTPITSFSLLSKEAPLDSIIYISALHIIARTNHRSLISHPLANQLTTGSHPSVASRKQWFDGCCDMLRPCSTTRAAFVIVVLLWRWCLRRNILEELHATLWLYINKEFPHLRRDQVGKFDPISWWYSLWPWWSIFCVTSRTTQLAIVRDGRPSMKYRGQDPSDDRTSK